MWPTGTNFFSASNNNNYIETNQDKMVYKNHTITSRRCQDITNTDWKAVVVTIEPPVKGINIHDSWVFGVGISESAAFDDAVKRAKQLIDLNEG